MLTRSQPIASFLLALCSCFHRISFRTLFGGACKSPLERGIEQGTTGRGRRAFFFAVQSLSPRLLWLCLEGRERALVKFSTLTSPHPFPLPLFKKKKTQPSSPFKGHDGLPQGVGGQAPHQDHLLAGGRADGHRGPPSASRAPSSPPTATAATTRSSCSTRTSSATFL